MKKVYIFCLILVSMLCASCEKKQPVSIEPQISQMRSICELAAMDCYYHNVARSKEADAAGWFLWKKDKHFWIEYTGIVTVGVDASRVTIEVKDDQVTITMPPARILQCKVDEKTLSEDSFVIDKSSAKISAQDQTEAFKAAQAYMEKSASEDTALLFTAQQRAQKLLEDYVNNIASVVGKQYQIKWVYVKDIEQQMEETVTK